VNIDEQFPKTIQLLKNGEPYVTADGQTITYRAYEVQPGYNVAVTQHDRDGSVRELRILDETGSWSGPGLQIYRPEVDYAGDSTWEAVPPKLNCSAAGSTDFDGIFAQIILLKLGKKLAEAEWEAKREALEAKAAEETARAKRQDEERRAQREVDRRLRDDTLEAVGGRAVRVKLFDRATPLVGTLAAYGNSSFTVTTKWTAVNFNHQDVEAFWVKRDGGRFEEAQI
jgi:hypothetical protein